jgi:hypothetical protein
MQLKIPPNLTYVTGLPRKALLPPHGHHEQAHLRSHPRALAQQTRAGLRLVPPPDSPDCARPYRLLCIGRRPQAVPAHARGRDRDHCHDPPGRNKTALSFFFCVSEHAVVFLCNVLFCVLILCCDLYHYRRFFVNRMVPHLTCANYVVVFFYVYSVCFVYSC